MSRASSCGRANGLLPLELSSPFDTPPLWLGSVAMALIALAFKDQLQSVKTMGVVVGTLIPAIFLLAIAVANSSIAVTLPGCGDLSASASALSGREHDTRRQKDRDLSPCKLWRHLLLAAGDRCLQVQTRREPLYLLADKPVSCVAPTVTVAYYAGTQSGFGDIMTPIIAGIALGGTRGPILSSSQLYSCIFSVGRRVDRRASPRRERRQNQAGGSRG